MVVLHVGSLGAGLDCKTCGMQVLVVLVRSLVGLWTIVVPVGHLQACSGGTGRVVRLCFSSQSMEV